MRLRLFATIAVLLCFGLPASAQIFDNSTLTFSGDLSIAGSGTDAMLMSVASNTPITAFAMLVQMDSPGNLKFFIYDDTTSAFVYTSAAKPFAADAVATFKQSDNFTLTLLGTDQYYFGTIADDVTDRPFRQNATTFTQGGLTSLTTTRNFNNFTNPTAANVTSTAADYPLKVFGSAVSTPEPGSLSLLCSTGMLGSLFALRLHRRRR